VSTKKTPANVTLIAKKTTSKKTEPAEQPEPTTDRAAEQPRPKSKMTWAEQMAGEPAPRITATPPGLERQGPGETR